MNSTRKCATLAKAAKRAFDYDLIVIGGGSGGLAASKEAVRCGAQNVLVFDYVRPTVHNTKWGLGGTCVNVGCVPKKLMHYSSLMGSILNFDAPYVGWDINLKSNQIGWSVLIEAVQNYIKKLNFNYRTQLRTKNVKYINALATVEGPYEIGYMDKNEKKILTTKNILISTGGRPYVPDESEVPGAHQYAITSDDLFSLREPPGHTLVVGASYIGLECAGFLHGLGFPVKVAVRSILLRGFDQQCATKVGEIMKEMGVEFIHSLPRKITKLESGKLQVEFSTEPATTEIYDTVIYATGRIPETLHMNLSKHGVECDKQGKIICENEQSSVKSIYCVGDCLHKGRELTPVAIKAGELLARRLFSDSKELMDWDYIPTTVFTPIEYGCCGLSEEEAIQRHGHENIEVFLNEFDNLESSLCHKPKVEACRVDEYDEEMSPTCLSKLICVKNENMRVVGIHFIGPNAGEVIQGYALALRLGATKKDFDACIGIHPTSAESFHSLQITKASGENFRATGGCGGGKCG